MKINEVILIGNLGGNPRLLNEKNNFTTFSLAQNYFKKNPTSGVYEQSTTNWFDIIAYGLVSETIMNFNKGDKIYVYGEIKQQKKLLGDKTYYFNNIIAKRVFKIYQYSKSNSNSNVKNEKPEIHEVLI